jgi:hypothetical protein
MSGRDIALHANLVVNVGGHVLVKAAAGGGPRPGQEAGGGLASGECASPEGEQSLPSG